MSKKLFKSLIFIILILIILINSVIAIMFFKGAGYKLSWEKEKKKEPQVNIEVTEVSQAPKEVNYNKLNLDIPKGILEVFENMFIKEKPKDKIIKIRTN